ncbi:MAG TPA: 4-alpha-glucanotransferase [Syntrophorhabdales bacterium]|nr:4-alpha-glucanotransferase [Syntrophorhabdales bacterium]
MKRRGSGILLHITSLPSPLGVGDLGPSAYRFVDFLVESGQSYWQVLPLVPTMPVHLNSPYAGTSAFAGNTLLISPELLVHEGLLEAADLQSAPHFPEDRVDYAAVHDYKGSLWQRAYERFKTATPDAAWTRFCTEEAWWLEGFALFTAIRNHFTGRAWSHWPEGLRDRQHDALRDIQHTLSGQIEMEKFLQYLFFKQWLELKKYCNEKGVQIIGDIPIYVNGDSADVWVYPHLFKLDEKKEPWVVAGVPPDYFSKTGQRWGNPIYDWQALKDSGYWWWGRRIAASLKTADFVRVDHFRGFVGYWEVPATEETAVNGRWAEAPAMDFFTQLSRKFPYLPIIAEDLGVITPDVREVMNHFEFPGMKILLFAFGQDMPHNPYIPHNLPKNCVAYTGTHDNNTTRGWFQGEASLDDKQRLFRYLGREISEEEASWELIQLLMRSAANTVILPLQDVLNLGAEARMNTPSTKKGNWLWRSASDHLTHDIATRLREMTHTYAR